MQERKNNSKIDVDTLKTVKTSEAKTTNKRYKLITRSKNRDRSSVKDKPKRLPLFTGVKK